jgi:F0F1-type ATP synthase membrane subunit b/b'
MAERDRSGIRVNLTLPEELVRVLDRMGKVTGTGRATIIRELLTEAAPGFAEMARALEMAKKKNLDAYTVLAGAIDSAVAEGSQLVLDIKKQRRAMVRKKKAAGK